MDSSTSRRGAATGATALSAVAGAQLFELRVRGEGRVLGPRDVVLDGADRALRPLHLDELAHAEHAQQAGQTGECAADADEADPEGQVRAFGDAERGRDRQEEEGEPADETGPAEQPGADARPLDLRRDLGLGELDLLVDESDRSRVAVATSSPSDCSSMSGLVPATAYPL